MEGSFMQKHDVEQNYEAWLKIAQEDLKAAKGLLKLELFSTVTFHCQQTAEKLLKTFLIFNRQAALKTHDLLLLLELCMRIDRNFEKIFDAASYLNPFSTKFRYPTEYDIPDLADAELAIKQAQKIMIFVTKKISEPDIGQINLFKTNL